MPFDDFAVIVAVPSAMPFTTPFETVATEVLFEDHVIVLSVAVEGETEAVRVVVEPTFTVADAGFTDTEVTSSAEGFSSFFCQPFSV